VFLLIVQPFKIFIVSFEVNLFIIEIDRSIMRFDCLWLVRLLLLQLRLFIRAKPYHITRLNSFFFWSFLILFAYNNLEYSR